MPRNDDSLSLAQIQYERWTHEFKELDYALVMAGPYDITTHLTALLAEAGVKGCWVVVMAALVPFEKLYPHLFETEETQDNDRPTEPDQQ